MNIDRAGFIERWECYCEVGDFPMYIRNRGYWSDGEYETNHCRWCRAELAVFTDPDGTRRPMVRRAGFWRDVALDLSECVAALRGFDIGSIGVLRGAVERVLAADGLNTQAAGETMQAEVENEHDADD